MRIEMWGVIGSIITVLACASVDPVEACTCPSSGPPCQNYFQVDAVFAGTVQTIAALPDDGPPLRPGEARIPRSLRVQFAVTAAFRGIQGSTVTLVTAGSGPACGYEFKQDEQYLVYAHRQKDGSGLIVSLCSRTRRLADAGDDVKFFEALARGAVPPGRISGLVTHWERDLATLEPKEHGPVRDVLVMAHAPGRAFESVTDAEGRYEIRGVAAGTYEIRAFPPDGFSQNHLYSTIELRDGRGCLVHDFGLRYDGRISGRLTSSVGESVAGAIVEVMAAARVGTSGNIETLRTTADASGSFEFVEVPPGRYVVGVDLTRRLREKLVFPATFHPGTADAKSATIIEMSGPRRFELEPMALPQARRELRLTGIVRFEDGTPVSDANVSLWDGAAAWRQVAIGMRTDPDGSFAFEVHEGLSYVASASYWNPDRPQQKQVSARVGPFVVSEATQPITVVLSLPH